MEYGVTIEGLAASDHFKRHCQVVVSWSPCYRISDENAVIHAAPEGLSLSPGDHCLCRLGLAPFCFEHGGRRGPFGRARRDREPREHQALGQPLWRAFLDPHPTRPASAFRQLASGRGGYPDPWQEALAVAGRGCQWRHARHPRANPQKCQGGKALSGKAHRAVRPAPCGDHRQTAQLFCADPEARSRRRSSGTQGLEQPDRGLT